MLTLPLNLSIASIWTLQRYISNELVVYLLWFAGLLLMGTMLLLL
jgi:hypothetical protein